jgi:branched-chain amino acid transport system ATP-binding protein
MGSHLFKTDNYMILEVKRLRKAFGGLMAVNNVDLVVKTGDIHAIIGPNGAGKTTFFNVITGYLKPTAGRVIFKDQDITNLPPFQICKKGIARSFQKVNIYPRLSSFENVQVAVLSKRGSTLNLFRQSKKMAIEETEKILEEVGLSNQANLPANSLSHGDKKRLELAITLGNDPDLLLLDEPTAGMSSEETEATMLLIERMARERGLTILFTEHDMSVVFGIAKKITVFYQGSIIAEGSPDEIRGNKEVQRVYLGE